MSPTRPAGPCTFPGCPNRSAGHGRCTAHAREDHQRFDRLRGTSAQRGYDAEWRAIRAEVLARQPVCSVTGCGRPSEDVDHEPRYVRGTDHLAYRLIGYCHSHHSARTSTQVR